MCCDLFDRGIIHVDLFGQRWYVIAIISCDLFGLGFAHVGLNGRELIHIHHYHQSFPQIEVRILDNRT